jgi:uncharacterized membrane protein
LHAPRSATRPIVLSFALLLAAFVTAPPAGAVAGIARSYLIEDFSAVITVSPDADIEVEESIRFRFDGSFQGIYRDIPLRYSDNLGFAYRLRMTVLSVTDGAGAPLEYEESNAGGGRRRVKVWVPGAQDSSRTVRIRYRVRRALRYFPEHDELYWNVTGNDWGVPIESASARVLLPEGLQDSPRVAVYVGGYGSRAGDGATAQVRGNEVEVQTDRGLDYSEGLTIVVGWGKGLVYEPGTLARAGWLLRDNWALGIPLLVLFGMISVWRRFGRDPDLGRSVMPLYKAPSGLTPAELGTLVDERVDQRDIVATVVDLAVRGYLRIEEKTEDGWFRDTITTTFVRLKSPDSSLKPHERDVLEGLFESGEKVTIDDLKNEFYTHLDEIRGHLYDGLVRDGYFRNSPHKVRAAWLVIGIIGMVGAIPLGAGNESLSLGLGIFLSGLIVIAFSRAMPARTLEGRRKWYEVKGFEEFLGRTEGDRLRELQFDVSKFEAFLPFAMALGVAEQWGRAFEGILQQPPDWYVGSGRTYFSPSHFSQRMNAVSSSVGTAMASAPRSSSGSSGFSGGSSGGGFGGGGGGAF